MSWSDFRVPDGMVLRPLAKHEYRFIDPATGKAWIYDEQRQTAKPEVPLTADLGEVPGLISALVAYGCFGDGKKLV